MAQVPSNLIPTRVSQLPNAPVASEDGLLLFIYQGVSYKIRAGDLLSVAGVPNSRQVIAGTGLNGGGQLSENVTLSIAPGGVGTSQLALSGVTPGVYGSANQIPVISVDATGRLVSATTITVESAGGVPDSRQVIAGTGLLGGGALNTNVTLYADFYDLTPLPVFQTGSAGVSLSLARGDHVHPAVDLSDDDQVDSILGLSNGGTARSLTPQPGAIVWSGADGLYVGPAGVAGQVLTSGGENQYSWEDVLLLVPESANSVLAGPVSGVDAVPAFRSLVNADLPSSGATPGSYGSSSRIPVVTVNSKGVVTSISDVSFSGGTVTSVDVSGSATGLTFTGGPITTSGVITLGGTLSVGNGGTGASSLTGYVKGSGTSVMTASPTVPTSDLSGTISNAQLTNSSTTVNGVTIALGASGTVTAVNPNPLTIGTGLSGTSYNGSAAVTVAISNTAVTAGAYGSGSSVPTFTVNAQGQLTLAANTAISINGNQITSGTVGSSYISGSYTGITGVGTLTTGTWNATTIGLAYGGSGQTTAQASMNAFAGAVTSGSYLRGNGTNVVMSAIQAADVPTLNQNTTGSAATLTTGRTISISGDLTYTSPSFNGSADVTAVGTLATVNANVGSFTNATITVNGKGLITAASSGTAPVTSVTGTSPVVSSGGATPTISLASGYGDTQNPYASKTANFFLAAPNGLAGAPTFRAVVAADIPTLNQNTTGTASNVTGVVAIANGGTGATAAATALTNLGAYPASNPSGYTSNTGTVTSVSGTAGRITSTGGNTPVLDLSTTAVSPGSYTLTSLTVDAYGRITAASNGTSAGTVTSVAALTLGTTGTDLSSSVANSTTTPVITLNVPTASATNRGALSSTDWSTFNNKQAALVSGTNIKTVGGISLLGSGDLAIGGGTF